MASEASVMCQLSINTGNLKWNPGPSTFTADVSGAKGPVPGAITVTTSGTDVDLSQLDNPGLCVIRNLDPSNYVEYGIWIPSLLEMFPLGKLLPGEEYVIRLSDNIGFQYGATGTGTGSVTSRLRFKANNSSCNVFIGAFES